MQLLNNYLEKNVFNEIKENFMKHTTEWYYLPFTTDSKIKDFFFYHMLYSQNTTQSNLFENIKPLLNKLNIKNLIRVKANLYVKQINQVIPNFHQDYDYDHKVCLLNLNSNNGYTEFENKHKYMSNENEALIFNGNIKHRGIAQTDTDRRINIVINYI